MEYEWSRRIAVPPRDAFNFVADVRTLPDEVVTVTSATPVGEEQERGRVRGTIDGAAYNDDGWLHADPDRHRIEWRDDEHEYRGWMTVAADYHGGMQVMIHLSMPPHFSPSGRPLTGERADEPDPIAAGLEAALDSLRQLLERTGGKERPPITT